MKIFGKKKGITEAVEAGADIAKAFSSKDNATERHATDMLTDNQLSKNIRPLILIWLMVLFTGMIVCSFFELQIPDKYQELIFYSLILAIGFYFPGRSAEKYLRGRK